MLVDETTITLKIDGREATFKGTAAQAAEFLHKVRTEGFDDNEWYLSSSKGWERIKDMATAHIGNAILKIYRNWVLNIKLAQFKNPLALLNALRQGPIKERFFRGLLAELNRRAAFMTDWKD